MADPANGTVGKSHGLVSHRGYRAFVRRLIDLTRGIQEPHHYIRLNKGARADLAVWQHFLAHFNGSAFFRHHIWWTSCSLHLYTDASTTLGFGAILKDSWFCGEWPQSWKNYHITLLELYPIVAAIDVWGESLANRRIILHTDNQGLMYIINKLTSQDQKIMILIRHFVKACMKHNILVHSEHIAGIDNGIADSLSRLQFQDFRRLAPNANQHPHKLPTQILPDNWKLI